MAAHQFEEVAKKLVIIFNIMFIGAGIALIVIGADADPVPVFDAGVDFGIGFAILGAVLLVCAVLGIVAAASGKRGLLSGYNVLLSLIVFTQIALASVFFSPFQQNIRNEIVDDVQAQVFASRDLHLATGSGEGNNAQLVEFSDSLQCCGWDISLDGGFTAILLQTEEVCEAGGQALDDTWPLDCNFGADGAAAVCDCIVPTRQLLDDVMNLMASVAMGTAVFELVVLFLTCGMAWVFHVKIEKDPTNVTYHR